MERIRLSNTVFEGRNNAYLFPGHPATLVDTGVAVAATRDQLESGLREHGVTFADIDRVLLTHYHADHSGLAGAIQEASGARVFVHPADAGLVERRPESWESLRQTMEASFDAWGMPPDQQSALTAYLDEGPELYGPAIQVDSFEDGDRFPIADGTLEVIHAPGHTAGLCAFAIGDEILTGDALLPVYTPNVGGADVRLDRPLERYLDTLRRLADRDFERAWPGHRDPIDDPAGRAHAIADHHAERAYRVLAVLADEGPADAWTVSAALFGSLERIHILHGPGEAFAHLDHLERADAVERVDGKYRITAEAAARLEHRPDERWPLT